MSASVGNPVTAAFSSHNVRMPPPLISIARARELVLEHVEPLDHEQVEVGDALDRVLAEDVHAAGDVPPFACSAMDGYAIKAGPAGRTLTVTGESRAGTPSAGGLREGEAIRISTGAAVPPGATAVIRQEDTEASQGTVSVSEPVAEGENIRQPGEDMRAGTEVLAAGTMLHAGELGAAVCAADAGRVALAKPCQHG